MMWMLLLFLDITTASLLINPTRIQNFRGNSHHISYTPKEDSTTTQSVQELMYPDALLDHFAPVSEAQLWRQRYFLNEQHWGGVGYPVFLYIGGEGPLSASVLTARNYIFTAAKTHQALLVALEHRFYGISYPTETMSTESLAFLSSSQALADLARFHAFLNTQFDLSTSQWISFGGSYPGALSAWFKLKYPALVVGAVASSAPLLAQEDFREYMEVVGAGYRTLGGQPCYDAIERAMQELNQLSQSPQGRKTLVLKFNPCGGDVTDVFDLAVFQGAIMGLFQDISQYNQLRKNTMTVSQVCDHFTTHEEDEVNTTTTTTSSSTSTSSSPMLDRLVSFVTQQNFPHTCVDSTFGDKTGAAINSTIEVLSRTSFDGTSSGRQWFYQTCNEFGYYQTTASRDSPFYALSSLHSIQQVAVEICQRVFHMAPTVPHQAVIATNLNYGGLSHVTVDNVTFPSGTIDPWHALAVSNTSNTFRRVSHSYAVFINGTAHCADMRAPAETDTPQMIWAHHQISAHIAQYLTTPSVTQILYNRPDMFE